eukprot:12408820-Karenia_brevis.AAC.1
MTLKSSKGLAGCEMEQAEERRILEPSGLPPIIPYTPFLMHFGRHFGAFGIPDYTHLYPLPMEHPLGPLGQLCPGAQKRRQAVSWLCLST